MPDRRHDPRGGFMSAVVDIVQLILQLLGIVLDLFDLFLRESISQGCPIREDGFDLFDAFGELFACHVFPFQRNE
jgi:hypothetical protein